MSRTSFYILNEKIKLNPIFHNQSRNPQADSTLQLAVTLYIMSQLGNGTVHFCEQLRTSAKIHLFPLYLMRHVRDWGPKYKTRLTVDFVHSA